MAIPKEEEEIIEEAIKERAKVLEGHAVNESIKGEIASLSLFMEACFAMATELVGSPIEVQPERHTAITFKLFDALMESVRRPPVMGQSRLNPLSAAEWGQIFRGFRE